MKSILVALALFIVTSSAHANCVVEARKIVKALASAGQNVPQRLISVQHKIERNEMAMTSEHISVYKFGAELKSVLVSLVVEDSCRLQGIKVEQFD
jgi:hypothetical protein